MNAIEGKKLPYNIRFCFLKEKVLQYAKEAHSPKLNNFCNKNNTCNRKIHFMIINIHCHKTNEVILSEGIRHKKWNAAYQGKKVLLDESIK